MKSYRIKKGHNLKISGVPNLDIIYSKEPDVVTFHPSRLTSFKTKLHISLNDEVKVGSPLFCDKNNQDVIYTSSVSGKIENIVFGKRRVVESISIRNNKQYDNILIDNSVSKDTLLKSGLWSLIRQKPFSKVPYSRSLPKSFFISSIPTEPFAINYDFLFKNINNYLQEGINVLKEIFNCDINIAVEKKSSFLNLQNVNFYEFNKLHPSGNVGIHIHHIDPIKNSNDTRWYLSMQDLNRIGEYFKNKNHSSWKYYSIGGNGVDSPAYYKAIIGTPIHNILSSSQSNIRYISGDVLNGKETNEKLSIDYYDDILSIIKTSDKKEFLGWMKPGSNKYSLSNTFLSKILSNRKSQLNTNVNGSIRSIIPMGNWESVLPMNIYPEFLIKSILSKDIDMMEKLGIYESSPEDFSLCSFVSQSKVEVSKIIKQGLDIVEAEI